MYSSLVCWFSQFPEVSKECTSLEDGKISDNNETENQFVKNFFQKESEPETEVGAFTQEQVETQIRADLNTISQQMVELRKVIQSLSTKFSAKPNLTTSSLPDCPSTGTLTYNLTEQETSSCGG